MRIIGIDPGTAIVGFGIVDCNGDDYKMVDAGVIRTPAKQALELRLQTIFDDLSEIIKLHKPEAASVEDLFFAQNVTTAMSVSHARGVILLAINQAKIEQSSYTPLQIKQAITGYGRADKKQMQEMVRIFLKLKEAPQPDDCADALAAAICHAQTVKA